MVISDDDVKRLEAEARPVSTKFAQQMITLANQKPVPEIAVYAGLLGTMTLQTIMTSMALQLFEPGSKEGEQFLNHLYHEALHDALQRWQKPDLKHHFGASRPVPSDSH